MFDSISFKSWKVATISEGKWSLV